MEPIEAFVESLSAGVYTCDAAGRVTSFNERAVELWGRRPSIGEPAAPLAPYADGASTLRERAARSNPLRVIERPDGSRLTVVAYAVPAHDAEGAPTGVTTTLLDVTEQLAVHSALTESETDLRGFFDSAAIGAAQTDMKGKYVRVNDRYCALTGYSREELLTMGPFDLDHPDDVVADRKRVEAFVNGQSHYLAEKRCIRKDGTVIWTHVAANLLRDGAGRPHRSAAVVVDITAHKRAEERLEEAARLSDDFLAVLGHELRNPLAPLWNSIELLRTGKRDAWSLGVIERQMAHLTRLVDDLLDVARFTKDKLELRRQRVLLSDIVEPAVDSARADLAASQQLLQIDLPSEPLYLEADPVRLTQVFANLLVNAAKFADRPGSVRLRAVRDGSWLRASVSDTGIGMAPEDIPRVFEKFFQSPQAANLRRGGLGIGLSLARRLVELHGGTLEGSSAGLGLGSEFVLTVPLGNAVVAPASRSPAGARQSGPKRILVIDDNRDAADSLCRLLDALGHRAVAAYGGRAGVELAAQFGADVLLLDLSMPDFDGFEVCRWLRADSQFDDLCIVALTGWGRSQDVARTRELGFDAHLVKPANLDAIVAVLDLACAPRRAGAAR